REVLQEAVDLESRGYHVRVRSTGKCVVVEDDGPGLKKADLALGNSSKREEVGLIGQFGEGLKLAALVAARANRRMTIETVGFSATPFIAVDPALGCEVLMFGLGSSTRTRGTRISVEATADELEAAKSLFVRWGPRAGSSRRQTVFLPGGSFYINGCLATKSERLLFSYDIGTDPAAKRSQNRDRQVVDWDFVRERVETEIRELRDPRLIERILMAFKNEESYLETTECWAVPKDPRRWYRVAVKLLGPKTKTVIESTSRDNLEAAEHGLTVIYPSSMFREVLYAMGYRTATAAIEHVLKKRWKPARLNEAEKAFLKKAVRAVTEAYASPGRVMVTDLENLALDGYAYVPGLYDPGQGVIWLTRRLFDEPVELVHVLLHETAHKVSGYGDSSRDFERELGRIAARMLVKAMR
ncbi:MAG: hypothetical protein ACPLRM_04455, partial [Anaerolineae bacterium]